MMALRPARRLAQGESPRTSTTLRSEPDGLKAPRAAPTLSPRSARAHHPSMLTFSINS